ncbi:MAG TPA: DMT family transporter, partial [Acidimicrobiia bacterium]|nr:DMT family transporter [Acidimicrobiia bacterium]
MHDRNRLAVAALALASLLFGASFVVVKDAVGETPPIGFVGWRFLVGALVLLAISRPRQRSTVSAGVRAGLLLFAGYALQTRGLVETTASNSGLVTGLYVVFTPLLGAAWSRRRPHPLVVVGAMVAFAGLAMLTVSDDLRLGGGDLWTIGAAVAYAGHILYLSRAASNHPVIAFTAVQLLVVAVAGLAVSAVFEPWEVPSGATLVAVVGTGVVVSGGAFLLQVWAQTVLGPSRTALILAL